MKTKTYIANSKHQLRNISNYYANAGTFHIKASNNIADVLFTNDQTNYDQAGQYQQITFGSNVLRIPDRCCYKFINMRFAGFAGKNISTIGNEAFYMCTSLQSIDLAGLPQLSAIGQSAFESCENLRNVSFPSHAIELKAAAFKKCSIQSLNATFRSNAVNDEAFMGCTQLTSAVVAGALGVKMFSGCTSLANVSIGASIASLPTQCFMNCSQLMSLAMQDASSISYIGDGAFSGCTSLEHFALEETNVAVLGSQVFFGTKIASVACPQSIVSPSQISPFFLSGSNVRTMKFLGMTSSYMLQHASEFTSFGANMDKLQLISSDGVPFKVISSGIVVQMRTAYVITVALSNTSSNNPLKGMYKDSARFNALVDKAYAGMQELILGRIALNDQNTPNSDGIGNTANLEQAFNTAIASGAEVLLFLFSDHGRNQNLMLYNNDATGNTNYNYSTLFAKFQKFKYVFAMFCCCYPNSPASSQKFVPGENNTKALFWCPCLSSQQSLMTDDVGHDFITLLDENFDSSLTWDEQWSKIDVDYMPYEEGWQIQKYLRHPVQYNYNNFPSGSYVFRVSNDGNGKV